MLDQGVEQRMQTPESWVPETRFQTCSEVLALLDAGYYNRNIALKI